MKKQTAVLGQAVSNGTVVAVTESRLSDKERISVLEQQVAYMQAIITKLKAEAKEPSQNAYAAGTDVNKDGIPVGLVCHGITSKSHFLLFLEVEEDGYVVGATKYDSLSAAAQAVSGVRRSGWTFWKLANETTLKEAFKSR
jgi:hypothetical protein